jgi:hypothetical protein
VLIIVGRGPAQIDLVSTVAMHTRRRLRVINSRQTMSASAAAFFKSSRRGLNWSPGNSLIPAPAFPLGLALYGGDRLHFGHVPFANQALARARRGPRHGGIEPGQRQDGRRRDAGLDVGLDVDLDVAD